MSGLQVSLIILTVSLGAFNFFLCVSILGGITKDRRAVTKRISFLSDSKNPIAVKVNESKRKRKLSIDEKAKGSAIAQWAKKKKIMDIIFNELVLADIMMKPEEFCIIWISMAFIPAGLAALFNAGIMPALTLAVLGTVLPLIFIKTKKGKRVKVFESQLGDTLIVICNCLRSGFSFQQSMETIARDMPAPIGIEFARVCNEIKYGATLEDALVNMTKRVKSPDLMLVVSAVCIQRTTGGNLSKILDTISVTIKDRLKIKGEITAITAQGRMSGLIIGALPVVLAAVLMVVNPDYMQVFFTTTPGKIMLTVSVVMEVIGFFAIRKVVTIEY